MDSSSRASPTTTPPADFCSTTRPADTIRGSQPLHPFRDPGGYGPEDPHRLDRRRTEEPPHRKRSSRAPPDNRPDIRCHPFEPREIGKIPRNTVGPRLRVQRPPRRGTPSNETRCLPPSATSRTFPSLAAGFHVDPFETPASTRPRFGLLPTRSPGLRHFYLGFHGHLGGRPLLHRLDQSQWRLWCWYLVAL